MRKIAFSLVELMVVLIVVSVVMIALTPIITKKLAKNGITIGASTIQSGNSDISNNCIIFDSNCALCSSSKCLICNSNYVLKNGSCEEQNLSITNECSDVDENCLYCTKESCLVCDDDYKLEDEVCVLKYRRGEPRNQADCDPYGAIFVDKTYNGEAGVNICVFLYGVGVPGGPENYTGTVHDVITIARTGHTCSNSNGRCVWGGKTSDLTYCNNGNNSSIRGGEPCYRAVMGHWAAHYGCVFMAVDGRTFRAYLLTRDIVLGWQAAYNSGDEEFKNLFIYDKNGLNYCVNKKTTTSTEMLCPSNSDCTGATGNMCIPHYYWTHNNEAGKYGYYGVNDDYFALYETSDVGYAMSARCFIKEVILK